MERDSHQLVPDTKVGLTPHRVWRRVVGITNADLAGDFTLKLEVD